MMPHMRLLPRSSVVGTEVGMNVGASTIVQRCPPSCLLERPTFVAKCYRVFWVLNGGAFTDRLRVLKTELTATARF